MIGERIRKVREDLDYTQDDLAEALDIAPLQINRYENNKTNPNGEMIARIATALNVSADYLLGLTDDPNPASFASGLNAKERKVIAAWRQGERFEAVKVIVDDE